MDRGKELTVHGREIQKTEDLTVQLVRSLGNDVSVVESARVSTQGERVLDHEWSEAIGQDRKSGEISNQEAGLINFLMRDRHGSPFEHNSMTFFLKVPMVVFWQMTRHRVGWSFNLESGRYRELAGEFYVPGRGRPLVQVGKAGAYEFTAGTDEQYQTVMDELLNAYSQCWDSYQNMLDAGVCRELARLVLPYGVYYSGYVTCNARSLMHFLSLRTRSKDAAVKSSPQYEINRTADMMEAEWAKLMPVTHQKFVNNGRVAP